MTTTMTLHDLLADLDDALALGGRSAGFTADTPLLGAVPELDSLTLMNLITLLEDQHGVSLSDQELDGTHFKTVGTLWALLCRKGVAA